MIHQHASGEAPNQPAVHAWALTPPLGPKQECLKPLTSAYDPASIADAAKQRRTRATSNCGPDNCGPGVAMPAGHPCWTPCAMACATPRRAPALAAPGIIRGTCVVVAHLRMRRCQVCEPGRVTADVPLPGRTDPPGAGASSYLKLIASQQYWRGTPLRERRCSRGVSVPHCVNLTAPTVESTPVLRNPWTWFFLRASAEVEQLGDLSRVFVECGHGLACPFWLSEPCG
jgi:hypothetical protein